MKSTLKGKYLLRGWGQFFSLGVEATEKGARKKQEKLLFLKVSTFTTDRSSSNVFESEDCCQYLELKKNITTVFSYKAFVFSMYCSLKVF